MSTGESHVFIVDDDPQLRDTLGQLIASSGITVHAFGSAKEFLAALSDSVRGCLILDVRLPDLNGFELFAELQRAGRWMPVIFLSGYGDIPTSVRAIKAGAYDFLTKPVEERTLLRAIAGALREEARSRTERVETDELHRRYESLTPREAEVMQHILSGRLNKQIGYQLGISEKTVKVHRSRVMAKMGAHSVAMLVRYAVRIGVVTAGTDEVSHVSGDVVPNHS